MPRDLSERHIRKTKILLRIMACLFLFSIAFFVSTFGKSAYQNYLNKEEELKKIKIRYALQQEKTDALQEQLDAVKNDIEYLEYIARDYLKYAKPDEYIFRIPPKAPPSSQKEAPLIR